MTVPGSLPDEQSLQKQIRHGAANFSPRLKDSPKSIRSMNGKNLCHKDR